MKKQYLDYAGLKRVLKHLLPGARKIWHGTLDEWKTLSEAERDKYDQAEIIDGSGYQPDYARNLHDPDWSNAEAVVDIKTSRTWTATKRGVIVSKIRHDTTNGYIKVNGIIVNACEHQQASEFNVTPVSPGDIVTEEPAGATYATLQFVPYKAQ